MCVYVRIGVWVAGWMVPFETAYCPHTPKKKQKIQNKIVSQHNQPTTQLILRSGFLERYHAHGARAGRAAEPHRRQHAGRAVRRKR